MARYINTISFCLYSPKEKDNVLPCMKFTLSIDELTFATLLRNIDESNIVIALWRRSIVSRVNVVTLVEKCQLDIYDECDNLNCSADDFFSQKYIITYGNRQGHLVRLDITEDSFSEFLRFVHKNKADCISLLIVSATNSDGTLETEVSKTQESSLVDGLISATDVEHLSAISRGPQDNTQFMKLADFIKIFDYRVNSENKNEMLQAVGQYIDNVVYDSSSLGRQLKREECNLDESGFLKVKRLYDYQIADWLKKGAKILVPRNNNEYMLMQFTELEGRSKFDRGLVHWQRKGSAYECDEIKIPVNISETAVKYDGYFNMGLIEKLENILDNYACQSEKNSQSSMKCSVQNEFQNYKQNQTTGLNKENEEFRAWLNEHLIQFKELVIQEVKNSLVVSPVSAGTDSVRNDGVNEVNAHSTNYSSSKDSESLLENVMNRLTLVEEHVYPLVDAMKSTSDMKPTVSQSRFMETDYVSDFSNKAYFEEWVKDRAVIMLEPDFYVISNTFRVKMPPNCSHSMKLLLVNRSKYRKSCEEVKLIPQVHDSAIEYNVEKNEELPRMPNSVWFSYHDISISSKNRCGKFFCFFKVMVNNRIINSDVLIKVRVSKSYQIPEPDNVFNNKLYTRKSSSRKKSYSTKKSAAGKKSKRWITTSTPSMTGSSDSEVSNIEETKRNTVVSDVSDDEIFTGVDKNSTEEDSSSSVSLMFDETLSKCEDNHQTVDKTDFVSLPRCFLINAVNNARDNVKIRVKRKLPTSVKVSSKSKKCPFLAANAAVNNVNMASTSHDLASMDSKKVINDNMAPNTSCLFPQPGKQFSCTATNTSSDSDSSLYATDGASKMENVEQSEKTQNKDERDYSFSAANAAGMLNKQENSSEGKDTQPLLIVPDKIFEMTNNVFKSVFNTIKPQSEGVKENVQKTFDETVSLISQVVASCSAVPPPPPPTAFQISTASSEVPVSFTMSMRDEAASKTSFLSKNPESTEVGASCSSVLSPPPLDAFQTSTATTVQSEIPVSFATSTCNTNASTSSSQLNKKSTKGATEGAASCATRDATTPLQKQLQKLNEMGFKNEKYNLFLLIKYQHDIDKVVDCLLIGDD